MVQIGINNKRKKNTRNLIINFLIDLPYVGENESLARIMPYREDS